MYIYMCVGVRAQGFQSGQEETTKSMTVATNTYDMAGPHHSEKLVLDSPFRLEGGAPESGALLSQISEAKQQLEDPVSAATHYADVLCVLDSCYNYIKTTSGQETSLQSHRTLNDALFGDSVPCSPIAPIQCPTPREPADIVVPSFVSMYGLYDWETDCSKKDFVKDFAPSLADSKQAAKTSHSHIGCR
ncbi:Piso0_002750 [Millerozyma farinosa CBS 7064]|uniref:Piso0_002750 protein n=1 Tax=Pichia sorbitophila (strain ATCC MYA-4447 / BCRC 22081 / CBS 7064 / NBRC 10061 / NRRL Y-12695) TaxID=559304 RepID=G8YFV7_PICSO|nr:Piso0_002750 [Millerozyma farinosa CBS 7064]